MVLSEKKYGILQNKNLTLYVYKMSLCYKAFYIKIFIAEIMHIQGGIGFLFWGLAKFMGSVGTMSGYRYSGARNWKCSSLTIRDVTEKSKMSGVEL